VITDDAGEEVSDLTIDSLTEALQINVTNTFDVGSVKVTKRVVGDGAARFQVELTCTHDVDGTQTPVDIPGGAERTLTEGAGFATYTSSSSGVLEWNKVCARCVALRGAARALRWSDSVEGEQPSATLSSPSA
jgi:hypothetical protein